MENRILIKGLLLSFFILITVSCEKGDGVELDENGEVINPQKGNQIVSGNPALNTFLIASQDETLYTVDAQTGEETAIYEFPYQTDFELIPSYKDGIIYVTADDNSINAVDVNTKSFVWEQYLLESDFSSYGVTPPTCVDGVCYASGTTGVLTAVNQITGDLKWYYTSDPSGELDNILHGNSSQIIHGDKIYVFSEESFISDFPPYMHILDKETGKFIQKVKLPYELTGTPLVVDNIMYLPAKNLYAINLDTMDVLWEFEANGAGTPYISGDRLIVNAIPPGQGLRSALYCIDMSTTSIVWQKDTGVDTLWNPLIVENVVYSNYDKGSSFPGATNAKPFAVDLESGEELWYNADVSVDHSPVYANGILFSYGHDLYRTDDTDNNVGLLTIDANTGKTLWLNSFFRYGARLNPLVIAENGVFGPSYYRGE
ncbi:PQQ-like beta-propeller repeat protein [Zobellia alginiliquefaciens]|uniref:PQQ-like beta-propeller repeat protein n=1 Tax=Zobellia alginiliquefaciens TaxID=3032586 RepID=UPI0023E35BA5|nr:PQQ-like beta-propeller repeat protein [Zobellia alginiliquefaciens]